MAWIIREALQNYLDENKDLSRAHLEGAGFPEGEP